MAFSIDITRAAAGNSAFRKVLSTGPNAQVVIMSIRPGEEIGEEVHDHVDQIFSFVAGAGVVIIEGEEHPVREGILVHVPAGMRHNVVNRGPIDLRLSTVYAPPQHAPGTIHQTKAEADRAEAAERLVAVR